MQCDRFMRIHKFMRAVRAAATYLCQELFFGTRNGLFADGDVAEQGTLWLGR